MDIKNESKTPLERFRTLVNFVCKQTDFSHLAVLYVLDAQQKSIGGKADQINPDPCRYASTLPGLIRMWLPTGQTEGYPKKSQFIKDLPPIILDTWEEEFVLVLAHELRHLDQFNLNRYKASQLDEAEKDAESFGYSIVELYRTKVSKRKLTSR